MKKSNWNPWRSISIDLNKNLQNYISDIASQKDMAIDQRAEKISKERFIKKDTYPIVDLIKITPRDLGFTHRKITYGEICKKAESLGLVVCNTEIALALRLEYINQPTNEYLFITDEVINDVQHGFHVIFIICNNEKKEISTSLCGGLCSEDEYTPGTSLIFQLKK